MVIIETTLQTVLKDSLKAFKAFTSATSFLVKSSSTSEMARCSSSMSCSALENFVCRLGRFLQFSAEEWNLITMGIIFLGILNSLVCWRDGWSSPSMVFLWVLFALTRISLGVSKRW